MSHSLMNNTASALLLRVTIGALLLAGGGCAEQSEKKDSGPGLIRPTAILTTKFGEIHIKFYNTLAPKHVERFIELADSGLYNGAVFRRVDSGLEIKGRHHNRLNVPQVVSSSTDITTDILDPETSDIPLKRGMVSMPRGTKVGMSNGFEFIVVMNNSASVSHNYSAFGEVTKGLSIVEKIASLPDEQVEIQVTIKNREYRQRPSFVATSGSSPELSHQITNREINMQEEWEAALRDLPANLVKDPAFTEAPAPNFKTLTFQNGARIKEVANLSHYEGKTALAIRSVSDSSYLEGVQLSTMAGLFPVAFQCEKSSTHFGGDSGMFSNPFGPTFTMSEAFCARFSVVRDVRGSLWPLASGQSVSANVSHEAKWSSSELSAEGRKIRHGSWGSPEQWRVMDERSPCHVGVSALDGRVPPPERISLTVLKGSAADVLSDFNVRVPLTGILWIMTDGKCQYLYSENLRWVVGYREPSGKADWALIGYMKNNGKMEGIQFNDAAKPAIETHKDKRARDLEKFYSEVSVHQASMAEQKRTEEELERQYSAEFSQELYKQLGVAFGTLATGLQQAQAIRQGNPSSLNALPDNNTLGGIPNLQPMDQSSFRTIGIPDGSVQAPGLNSEGHDFLAELGAKRGPDGRYRIREVNAQTTPCLQRVVTIRPSPYGSDGATTVQVTNRCGEPLQVSHICEAFGFRPTTGNRNMAVFRDNDASNFSCVDPNHRPKVRK